MSVKLYKAGRKVCISAVTTPGMMLSIKAGDAFKWRCVRATQHLCPLADMRSNVYRA